MFMAKSVHKSSTEHNSLTLAISLGAQPKKYQEVHNNHKCLHFNCNTQKLRSLIILILMYRDILEEQINGAKKVLRPSISFIP